MTGGAPAVLHVVGAGLAGLAAAVRLAAEGCRVRLYEASRHAGGRCRSYDDRELGCRLDNGNHLLLSGNRAALDYLDLIGARDTLDGPPQAVFPFIDAASGRRWAVRPNDGVLPWWIFSRRRRVPQTRARDYLEALKLRRADPTTTVAQTLDGNRMLYRCLWEPLAVAALNTAAERASARLFWRLLAETLGRGGGACRPLVPRQGLSESLVDPALARLRAEDAEIRFGLRLKAFGFDGDRVGALIFDEGAVSLRPGDGVVLAVPAAMAARLVPGLSVPDAYAPIVNAHFRHAAPPESPLFIGVVGGAAEWIFRKPGVLSVTVSAADRFVDRPVEALGELFWRDVALAFELPPRPLPPARIVKERRATFLASPEQLRRRPMTTTPWANLLLAGDYVNTGLPATIEGAIRSGFAAAQQMLDQRHGGLPQSGPERQPRPVRFAGERQQEGQSVLR